MIKNQKLAYIYALLAVTCWSTVATAFKIALQHVDYVQLLMFSSFVAALALFIIILIQGKFKSIKNQSTRDVFLSMFLGFLNPLFYYLVLFKAYSLLPAQQAQTLNYTWVIMLVLLSIPFLKQKVSFVSIISVFICFFGAFVISTGGNILNMQFTSLPGVLLALGSSIIWALYWIFNLKDKRDEILKLFMNFSFGFILSLISTYFLSEYKIPDLKGFLSVTYIGLFEMGITFMFWLKALNYSKSSAKISHLIYLSPFVSLVLINFILKEPIKISTLLGFCLILLGIFIQEYFKKTSK